jgi:hypothetical protein
MLSSFVKRTEESGHWELDVLFESLRCLAIDNCLFYVRVHFGPCYLYLA